MPHSLIHPEGSLPDADPSLLVGKRVVVVEDEGVTQLQLRRILTQAGVRVVAQASNGEQGVEAALRERPDLILMDIQMPVLGGFDAARRILAELRTCVVFVSAFNDAEHLEQARALGACGYALKPVSTETLLPLLARCYAGYLQEKEPPVMPPS